MTHKFFHNNDEAKESISPCRGCRIITAGNSKGTPFLMIGPTEPYLQLFPKEFLAKFDIRYIEDYWHIGYQNPKNIDALTITKLIDDVEVYRRHMWPDKKVIVFAPSAVGLIALGWAKKYPQNVLDILCFGTPTTMKDLSKRTTASFIINHHPRSEPNEKALGELVNKLGIDDGKFVKKIVQEIKRRDEKYHREPQILGETAVWSKFCDDVKKHAEEAAYGVETTNGCIAEYRRDETRYYPLDFANKNRGILEQVYQTWAETFNIPMRKKFFSLMLENGGYEAKLDPNKRQFSCFFALGIKDGIVPLDVVDSLPQWCNYHIFDTEAHVMMANNPEKFATVYLQHLEQTPGSSEQLRLISKL